MDQGGSGGPSEKGSDDGYALVLEPVGFTKRLCRVYNKKGSRMPPKILT